MTNPIRLLAVPNISEGRDASVIKAIGDAFTAAGTVQLLDVHSDPDHHRSVYTLAGEPGSLSSALLAGAKVAVESIDISDGRGVHPHVGVVDVVPLVYLDPHARGAAFAEALVTADMIGEHLHMPVFLYGPFAQGRSRAQLRAGGAKGLAQRLRSSTLNQDFGPHDLHPSAGAALIGARPPLVAFNLELEPGATVQEAQRIAALVREGGEEGLPGLRAIGVWLAAKETAQVSMNVEQPYEVPLRAVIEAVRRHAQIAGAELIGLAPGAALEGFPDDVPMPGFDPSRHLLENALAET